MKFLTDFKTAIQCYFGLFPQNQITIDISGPFAIRERINRNSSEAER